MCVAMTHGESNGYILAYDKKYEAKNLWENFVGTKCETLIGKPKLFFIQVSTLIVENKKIPITV